MMKKAELKKKDINELNKALDEKRKDLDKFYGSVAGGSARDVKEARNIRKDIARILTEINSRQ